MKIVYFIMDNEEKRSDEKKVLLVVKMKAGAEDQGNSWCRFTNTTSSQPIEKYLGNPRCVYTFHSFGPPHPDRLAF